jgi:hypothetical protein
MAIEETAKIGEPAKRLGTIMARKLFAARSAGGQTVTLTREQVETLCAGAFQAGVMATIEATGLRMSGAFYPTRR